MAVLTKDSRILTNCLGGVPRTGGSRVNKTDEHTHNCPSSLVCGQRSGTAYWVLSDWFGFHHLRRKKGRKKKKEKRKEDDCSFTFFLLEAVLRDDASVSLFFFFGMEAVLRDDASVSLFFNFPLINHYSPIVTRYSSLDWWLFLLFKTSI